MKIGLFVPCFEGFNPPMLLRLRDGKWDLVEHIFESENKPDYRIEPGRPCDQRWAEHHVRSNAASSVAELAMLYHLPADEYIWGGDIGIDGKMTPFSDEPPYKAELSETAKRNIQNFMNKDNQLRTLRCSANLTQQQLADKSGVSVFAIRKIERGERQLVTAEAGTVQALAKALGCSMEELLK